MINSIAFYDEHASALAEQYDKVLTCDVHRDWLHLLPKSGHILDIGCGSGRDARYLSSLGLVVHAVEPSVDLLNIAKAKSQQQNIHWYQDQLPALSVIKMKDREYDVILMSAVWMHLTPEERLKSITRLSELLSKDGRLVITLRYGEFTDGRISYPVSADECVELGQAFNLNKCLITANVSDTMGRSEVTWQTVVLQKA